MNQVCGKIFWAHHPTTTSSKSKADRSTGSSHIAQQGQLGGSLKRDRRVIFSHRDLGIQVFSVSRILLALLKDPLDTHIDLSVILGLLQATQASHVPRTLPSSRLKAEKPTTTHFNEPKFKESTNGLLRMGFHMKKKRSSNSLELKRERDKQRSSQLPQEYEAISQISMRYEGLLLGADVHEADHMLQRDRPGISHSTMHFSTRPR